MGKKKETPEGVSVITVLRYFVRLFTVQIYSTLRKVKRIPIAKVKVYRCKRGFRIVFSLTDIVHTADSNKKIGVCQYTLIFFAKRALSRQHYMLRCIYPLYCFVVYGDSRVL